MGSAAAAARPVLRSDAGGASSSRPSWKQRIAGKGGRHKPWQLMAMESGNELQQAVTDSRGRRSSCRLSPAAGRAAALRHCRPRRFHFQ